MSLARVTSDVTVVGTAFADVTGLSFSLAANKSYYVRFFIRYWVNATTTGPRFAVNGPAGTTFKFGAWTPVGTGGTAGDSQNGVVTAYDTAFIATTAGQISTTALPGFIEGWITTTGTAGTLTLRAAAEVVSPGSVTVAAESFGICEETTTMGGFVSITSDLSPNTSTTSVLADATGLTFPVEASKTYHVRFVVFYVTDATTTGARFALNGPASPTSVRIGCIAAQGAQLDSGTVTAYETLIAASTTGPGTTQVYAIVDAIIVNGSNAGNVVLRFVGENVASATMTIKARSFGFIQEMG